MKVFISHIHEEAKLALVLKEWIESTFTGQVEVFVSSDIQDIPAGSKWLSEIDSALIKSSLFLLLCSKESISRPWINFEFGCAWVKKAPSIPICHSGFLKSELPSPLSSFQALEMNSDKFIENFFESLKIHFHVSKLPRIDKNAMLQELKAAVSLVEYILPISIKQKNQKIEKISDDDALNVIQSWLGSRPGSENRKTIWFADVDNELNLPEGTAKKLIESAAKKWFTVGRRGEDTILFEEIPFQPIRRRIDGWL